MPIGPNASYTEPQVVELGVEQMLGAASDWDDSLPLRRRRAAQQQLVSRGSGRRRPAYQELLPAGPAVPGCTQRVRRRRRQRQLGDRGGIETRDVGYVPEVHAL